ncbi:unnamed protein product [Clavelina lepadiformis]|uniref:Uncharacterized protein n=1 Tax=Clavelina lepadiformis TaxID=159417 RepID=A0ABP0FJX9_CLALP
MSQSQQKRFKFITPQLRDSCLPAQQLTPKHLNQKSDAGPETPAMTSQGVSVNDLLGDKAKIDTPALKSILIQKMVTSQNHHRKNPNPLFDESAYDDSTVPSRHKMISQLKTVDQNEEYTFPSSPSSTKKTKKARKSAELEEDRRLLRYVLTTMDEIAEIRNKRKILKDQGISGLKRFKKLI